MPNKEQFVHILELTEESAKGGTNDEIKANGEKVFSHSCNVANQQEVVATFKKIGNINILVNNAGIAHIGKVDTTPEADFDRIMNVNVKRFTTACVLPYHSLQKSNGGVIVNMASKYQVGIRIVLLIQLLKVLLWL